MDKKNAAGVSKDLKKSEMIDWRNHETLNKVTKTAIQYFEGNFHFGDYMAERTEKESKISGQKGASGQKVGEKGANQLDDGSEMNSDLEEEEEDDVNPDWNRAMAESLYTETKQNLNLIYATQETEF